jgi:hypothetical protein
MDQTEYVEELVPGEVDGRLKDDQLLRFPRITGPVAMVGYCDAAWGNLSDGKTGGGLFLCLAAVNPYGGNEVFCPVGWSSKRLRRVVRSTFAGETLIASEVLDEVIYLADTWAELGGGSIDRIIRTDSKSLYDHVLLKGTCTTPYDRIEDQEE